MSDVDLTEALALGTATLYEAAAGRAYAVDPAIRPLWTGARVAGCAYPVAARRGDNLPLHRALVDAQAGDVLVVDAGGGAHGYWGEVMTVAAQVRGIAGLVIDGGARDIDRLETLGFPVFARWTAIRGTTKRDPGALELPVEVGGVPVARGDLVVADRDGVVIVPTAAIAGTLAQARARAAAEERMIARLRDGESTISVYGLQGGRS